MTASAPAPAKDHGRAGRDLKAAITSGVVLLVAIGASLFFWKTAGRWRPLLVVYPLAMAFTLVYTGEHYVIDILLGWLYAAAVVYAGNRLFDRFTANRRSAEPEPEPVRSSAYAGSNAG